MSYKLGIVNLFVRDVRKVRAFYVDVLGLQEIPEFSSARFVFLRSANGFPMTIQDAKLLPEGLGRTPGGFDLGFGVENIDAVWQELKAKNVEVLTEVMDMGAGRTFLAKDPEGNYLSMYELYEGVQEIRKRYGIGT